MTYSAYKLNKQGDNIQPWHTPFPIWNQSVVPCPVLTLASWPAYRFHRRPVESKCLKSALNTRCVQYTLAIMLSMALNILFVFLWMLKIHVVFFLLFKKLINFNWRLITLQYCSGFHRILTRISHGCTHVPHPEVFWGLCCTHCLSTPSFPLMRGSCFQLLLPFWRFFSSV